VRFDGEETHLREPGMPVSSSRSWQREVQNYTAKSLNKLLATDEASAVATTTVSFDLASPASLQVGPWKEMAITLTSTLPDGSVVKSEPVVGNIDSVAEYGIVTALGVGGTILDVGAAVASIWFVFEQSFEAGAVFIGALVGGLTLHLAQNASEYVVSGSEERRWSDLFVDALEQHADDVRSGKRARAVSPSAPPPPLPPKAPPDPSDPAAPPPLLPR
jgi:hypothetical protein